MSDQNDPRSELERLRAQLTGIAIHAHRLKVWAEDDKASVVVAGSIIGDLLAALNDSAAAQQAISKPDWRERARARVGDEVAARMAELDAEPPMTAEEFDEAMRRNKAEAEASLYEQSCAAFGRPDGEDGQ